MRLGSTAVINELIQAYPVGEVVEHLEQLYRKKIKQVGLEVEFLLWHYRTRVDAKLYEQERAKVRYVQACEAEGTLSVRALEASLKCLLQQRQKITDALRVSSGV